MTRERLTQLALSLAAIVHLLPLPGVLGERALRQLYGLPALNPTLELLLQHRAMLFGLIALPLLIALRIPSWRMPAASFGLLSVLSFLLLALCQRDAVNAALWRVIWADLLILPMLLWVMLQPARAAA